MLLVGDGSIRSRDDGDVDTKRIITSLSDLGGVTCAQLHVACEGDSRQAFQQGRLARALVSDDDELEDRLVPLGVGGGVSRDH